MRTLVVVAAAACVWGGAERSFRYAAALDPDCAMCWWGVAYVLGPNINARMSPEAGSKA
jgi:hypothetical protein